MSEQYYVIKREACDRHDCDPLNIRSFCDKCQQTGYIETRVPLIDVLKLIVYRDLPDDGETRRLVRDNATISKTKLPI